MDISTLSSWQWKCLYFGFYLYGNAKVCFFNLPICSVDFSMKSEWNESCTESISYKQVNSSIIKDQIGVLSVLVCQPALEGHLVADHGKAWPCSEAFSGYCHHNGDLLVLSDSSIYCWVFFFVVVFKPFNWHSPKMIQRTPHSGNTWTPTAH